MLLRVTEGCLRLAGGTVAAIEIRGAPLRIQNVLITFLQCDFILKTGRSFQARARRLRTNFRSGLSLSMRQNFRGSVHPISRGRLNSRLRPLWECNTLANMWTLIHLMNCVIRQTKRRLPRNQINRLFMDFISVRSVAGMTHRIWFKECYVMSTEQNMYISRYIPVTSK